MIQNTQKMSIILSGPKDWDDWIKVVKTKALVAKIWDYVDPDVSPEKVLSEPNEPTHQIVNPTAKSIDNLNQLQLQRLHILLSKYTRELSVYQLKDKALGKLRVYIQASV